MYFFPLTIYVSTQFSETTSSSQGLNKFRALSEDPFHFDFIIFLLQKEMSWVRSIKKSEKQWNILSGGEEKIACKEKRNQY